MGNSIYANDEFEITPAIPAEQVALINCILAAEHRNDNAHSVWCDYRISDDGSKITIPEGEGYNDSLDTEWLNYIITELPEGTVVNGSINYNDSYGEYWIQQIVNNKIFHCSGYIAYEDGIEEKFNDEGKLLK